MLKDYRKVRKLSNDGDLVFSGERGQYRRQGNDRRRLLQPLYEKCEGIMPTADHLVGGKLGFHMLRHYGISAWINAGLNAKTVSTFAGHASIAITMDRYGHLFPSDDHAAAMDRIASALSS
jgi:integrase